MKRLRAFLLVAAVAAASTAGGVDAAGAGLAYDSVTKFNMGTADPSTIQPGSFDADYKTASAVQTGESGGGGLLGQYKKAMQMAKAGMAALTNGTATRTYIAGSKEREEYPSLQTATITDCTARTITTLDLAKKTYKVVSMDQPETPSSSGPASTSSTPSPIKDDGTKVSMVVTTKALGPKDVDGQPTSGYNSDIKMTATKPTGESSTSDMNVTAYYAAMARPSLNCTLGSASGPSQMRASSAQYALAMKAMMSHNDPRFKVTASGPPLPAGQLAMFEVAAFSSDKSEGKAFAAVTERGNVRPISASDPAFSVPPDFTKEP